MDTYGRKIDYLRIAVTDRCNERCFYCMPRGYQGWIRKSDHLTADEIIHIADCATQMGFRKFRLTGGEPLLRTDIVEIAQRLHALPGTEALGLSTNATHLKPLAKDLQRAGVRSINISLDTLDPVVYKQITGGNLSKVLSGIDAAIEAHFEMVKLNCVLMRNINESALFPLIQFAAEHHCLMRFVELMPLTRADVLDESHFLSITEVMHFLQKHGSLTPLPDYRPGNGPARYYEFNPLGVKLGFIGALTTPHFCATCNKLRLTADGKLRPCLGRQGEMDLVHSLRAGYSAKELLQSAIANKPVDHQFSACYTPGRPMTAIGG